MYVVYLSGRELKQLEGAPLQTMIRADTYLDPGGLYTWGSTCFIVLLLIVDQVQ